MALLNYGTKANYLALATKDESALYFCTDTLEVFKGSSSFSQAARVVAAYPTTPAQGVVYILSGTGEASIYNGSDWVVVARPNVTSGTLSGKDTADTVPVSKVVYDTVVAAQAAAMDYADDILRAANLAQYAPLASPALTGTPTAPTAAAGTNTTQIATTEFVTTAVNAVSTALASAFKFKGSVDDEAALEAITGMANGDVYQVLKTAKGTNAEFAYDGEKWVELGTILDLSAYSTTEQVNTLISNAITAENLAQYAKLAGAAFTGEVTGVTATKGDSSTKFATTEFVAGAVADAISAADLAQYAKLAGAKFTGEVTGLTADKGDNSTKFATTAFVQTAAADAASTALTWTSFDA